jgi:hypothetical protein
MTWIAARLFLQGIPLRVWAILAAVVLLAASGLYLRAHYIGVGESRVQAQWDAREAGYALQRAEAAIAARNIEQRHRAEYKAIADRFLAQQKEADENHDRVVAGLRAGSAARPPLECPKPQPIPAELLKPAKVDFLSRMQKWCCEPEPTPTPSPGN